MPVPDGDASPYFLKMHPHGTDFICTAFLNKQKNNHQMPVAIVMV